ncbi:uncharacterized protein LOC106659431 [Trichogramma pretiosum]|uniref:uncharacterized protein LOC106659431 n=1 Tax=Trichogramma pretiosum TaxID=7493 RepID=UPI0006C983F1|nr:uncharacterized protein LOC106659431 [Trichogramma pretiosum]
MSASKKQKMSHSPLGESREEKRNRFIKIFIEKEDWQEEDLLGFIVDEFDGNVEDVNWILKTAVESKSWTYNIVEVLMKNGTELQVLNNLGQTAIHIAAMNDQSHSIIDELLNYIGDENLSDHQGFTYFHVACMYGCNELVQKYIDQGVDINLTFYKDGRKESPLSLCIENELCQTLELLLDSGADLKSLDDWNKEPLSCLKRIKRDTAKKDYCVWKIITNHYFEKLLKGEKDSALLENRSDSEGFTYLHAACLSGNIEMVQKFIHQKNNLDLIWRLADGTKESPLTLATEFKRIKILEMLLENGADPNMKDLGKNPLHVFFKFFLDEGVDSSLLDLLISYNCDVNEKDNDGRSPLFLCFENCNEQYNCCDPQPWAPWRVSKLFSDRENLETLLKNKADANEVFENGQSILHLFIKSDICRLSKIDVVFGNQQNTVGIELIKTLLKYGADVNVKDDNGESPLHLAVLSCNFEVVEVLLAHGADVQSIDFSKLNWEYDWSTSWLDKMIKFFLILHCLNDKGHKMNESSCLIVLKFLTNQISHSELIEEWERKLLVGSLTQIRSLLTDDKDFFFANLVHKQLLIVEKYNSFMTTEMKDYLKGELQQLNRFCRLKEEDIRRLNDEVSIEIENLKKLEIKDGVFLWDVCASIPKKRYHLLKNSKLWTVIKSKEFEHDFSCISDVIKGYIIKCFMTTFFVDFGLKYLMLLTQGKLPILCCENLIKYLDNEDILNVCQVYLEKN